MPAYQSYHFISIHRDSHVLIVGFIRADRYTLPIVRSAGSPRIGCWIATIYPSHRMVVPIHAPPLNRNETIVHQHAPSSPSRLLSNAACASTGYVSQRDPFCRLLTVLSSSTGFDPLLQATGRQIYAADLRRQQRCEFSPRAPQPDGIAR